MVSSDRRRRWQLSRCYSVHVVGEFLNFLLLHFFPVDFTSLFLVSLINRASKPSVVQPVCSSTSKSKHATGRQQWRTARSRAKSAKWSHCWSPMSRSVRTVFSRAAMAIALSEASSATVRKTAPMDLMKIRAVSFFLTFWRMAKKCCFCCEMFSEWSWARCRNIGGQLRCCSMEWAKIDLSLICNKLHVIARTRHTRFPWAREFYSDCKINHCTWSCWVFFLLAFTQCFAVSRLIRRLFYDVVIGIMSLSFHFSLRWWWDFAASAGGTLD